MGWLQTLWKGRTINKFYDLRGKNIIITGASSGVGFMTAQILALLGANVILACRNSPNARSSTYRILKGHEDLLEGKGDKNLVEFVKKAPQNQIAKHAAVDYIYLDLKSRDSIESFVKYYTEKYGELHVLINNAAIRAPPVLWKTEQDFEISTGVNYLGHFYLTNLLVPNLTLKNGQKSRIINVTCHHFRFGQVKEINEDSLIWDYRKYRPYVAYSRSKLYNLIFSNELNRRLNHLGIYSNAINPGYMPNSSLNRYSSERNKRFGKFNPIRKLLGRDLYHGAQTSVYIASDPSVEGVGGKYFSNCREVSQSKRNLDPEQGRKLWESSEAMWGMKFDHSNKE